jgi:hypothetical protein
VAGAAARRGRSRTGQRRGRTPLVDSFHFHALGARVRAAGDRDRSSRHAESLSQQLDEFGVGGALDRR